MDEPWAGLEIGNRELQNLKIIMVLQVMAAEGHMIEIEHIRDVCDELINEGIRW